MSDSLTDPAWCLNEEPHAPHSRANWVAGGKDTCSGIPEPVKPPPPSLAEDVIARHAPRVSSLHGPVCSYECKGDTPCDAYRLAVMVRDVEALAVGMLARFESGGDTAFDRSPTSVADRILAITRAVTP